MLSPSGGQMHRRKLCTAGHSRFRVNALRLTERLKMKSEILLGVVISVALSGHALAQFEPLDRPPVPEGNPMTPEKIMLGKALFWDEQLSSTRLTACATCHRPAAGGSDPRSIIGDFDSTHPGPDQTYWTDDDITASPGIPMSKQDGIYLRHSVFDMHIQVGRRRAPSAINAGYSPLLFWDGRVDATLTDPITGQITLEGDATLESQATKPVLGTAEMGHVARDWTDVVERIADSRALALATDIPRPLKRWLNGRTYPELFQEVFGSPEVTASRVVMAIATYERTLYSNQTPFDQILAGAPIEEVLTEQEQLGWQVFNETGCIDCHPGNRLTDEQFHYIGVRPPDEDLGRMEVTGLEEDKGKFRTPSLRNIELRAPYFHNGQMATLEEVMDFYDRGGDFDAPNKHPLIRPLNLTQEEEDALVALMKRPLTDQRLIDEVPPFDHPTLYTDSGRMPRSVGEGLAGSGGFVPGMIAFEPPLLGNDNFTVAIEGGLGRTRAYLLIKSFDPVDLYLSDPEHFDPSGEAVAAMILDGFDAGQGSGSACLSIPRNPSLHGRTMYGRWFVEDPGAALGWSFTPACEFTLFK